MKLKLVLAPIALLCSFAFAQENWPKPSAASLAYGKFRTTLTEPLYGLTKVKSLIKKIKEDSDGNRKLSESVYNGLSVNEKFTYVMLHGEDYSQNCDVMPPIVDEHKKIFPYFPSPFGDESIWSDRQRNFLHANRSKVVSLLRETIRVRGTAGANVKEVIAEINGNELIPDLISIYNKTKKDNDILTLFMIQMDAFNYKPFTTTSLYKSLYGEEADYQAFVPASTSNINTILKFAKEFYNNRMNR